MRGAGEGGGLERSHQAHASESFFKINERINRENAIALLSVPRLTAN